jgi:SNF2 family DNA or RNA helicase
VTNEIVLNAQDVLRERALKLRNQLMTYPKETDVKLPELKYWNEEPCADHNEPTRGCHHCGGSLRRHQRGGVTWLYMNGRGLVADPVGLGKTNHIIGLLCLMKDRGELTNRALIVVRPPALMQWRDELNRFAPRLSVEIATGTRQKRIRSYTSNADVILIGFQMMLRDQDILTQLGFELVVADDVDPIRNLQNQTAQAFKRLSRLSNRAVVMSGTPIQTRLHEMYAILSAVDQDAVLKAFGTERQFRMRYVREQKVTLFDKNSGKKRQITQVTGYKNMDEFKRLAAPFFIRRKRSDVDDAQIPELVTEDLWFDLYARQKEKYTELQAGVLRIMTEEGEKVKQATAISKLLYGAQICGGLASIGEEDGPEASVKLDWLEDQLAGGDLSEDKVVVFMQFKATIRAFQARMRNRGVGFATIWGDEPDPLHRRAEQERFWNDPTCRVMVGTSAMEQSLNLQVARVLVNVDTLLNPRRMEQLSGRIQRDGSAHENVYIFNLLTRDTQEERYLPILEARQALGDFVFGETSELYNQLSPLQLLHLIKP